MKDKEKFAKRSLVDLPDDHPAFQQGKNIALLMRREKLMKEKGIIRDTSFLL